MPRSRTHGRTGRTADDDFIDLLTRHRSQLFGFIFCIVRNLPDAEDVFQQTSITLWDKFADFSPGTDFLAWATAVARNKALTFVRSRSRERAYFAERVVEELADRGLWNEEDMDGRLQALARCQQKLPPADRTLLSLCYGPNGTIRDVAQEMGRPVDSVYGSLSRIRRALYECIRRTLAREGRA